MLNQNMTPLQIHEDQPYSLHYHTSYYVSFLVHIFPLPVKKQAPAFLWANTQYTLT